MAKFALNELLALGAGGSAGMVSLNGTFLGLVGEGDMVEVDEAGEAVVLAAAEAALAALPPSKPDADPEAKPAGRRKAKPVAPVDPAEPPTGE